MHLNYNLIFLHLILFVGVCNSGELKMMKIFGMVEKVDIQSGNIISNKECVDNCFEQEDCILAFMNLDDYCVLLGFNQTEHLTVLENTRAERYMVAIKTTLPTDNCPSYDNLDLFVTFNGTSISWKKTENGWTFDKCVGDWTMFHRENSDVVCMQTFNFSKPITRNESILFCEGMGYKLTGVASTDESSWLRSRVKEVNEITKFGNRFWVDGIRVCNETNIKCNNFEWSDGYTVSKSAVNPSHTDFSHINNNREPENCLTSVDIKPWKRLNDVSCTGVSNGVACGYKLV